MTKGYGQSAAEISRARETSILVSKSLKRGTITATQLDLSNPHPDPTPPTPVEDSVVIAAWQSSVFKREIWIDEKVIDTPDEVESDAFTFMDLRQRYTSLWKAPFSGLLFTIPRSALMEVAEQAGTWTSGELNLVAGTPRNDPVIAALAQALQPTMAHSGEVSTLFVDHITRALAAHVLQAYGDMQPEKIVKGGLTPWQRKRLLDLLDANLDGDVTIAQMAQECGLSTRHLSRAFKETLGVPPYQWVLQRRMERARQYLAEGFLTLEQIAGACGFVDQSHFTRAFTKTWGTSPAAWRRQFR